MTVFLRVLSSFFILWLSISQIQSVKAGVLVFFFLAIVSPGSSVRAVEIFRRNLVIFSFIIFYTVFGIITVFISGGSYCSIAWISLKIILVYNVIWMSLRWLGTTGMLVLMDLIHSENIRLYLTLVAKGISVFKRNSGMIIMQIRSRLEPGRNGKRILVRYYVRNMIFRDVYSVHYLQAALYSRLPERLYIHAPGIKPGLADGIICIAIALYILTEYIVKLT